ncbi:hypothetical protein MSPP1_001500 [Malassezia sp. CBS 17886]|nr:hypothetical protein MSPP1_001500 [Malassezia sp. CBS 17886]
MDNGHMQSPPPDRHMGWGTGGRARSAGSTVFVYGLSGVVREAHLDEIFGFYGTIHHIRLVGATSPTQRPWAAIEYENDDSAFRAADHMDRGQIDGRTITVSQEARRDLEEEHDAPRARERGRAPRVWGARAEDSRGAARENTDMRERVYRRDDARDDGVRARQRDRARDGWDQAQRRRPDDLPRRAADAGDADARTEGTRTP